MTAYAYTILYVRDVARSISFYKQAFGFQEKFVTPKKDYGELATGGVTLAFASLKLAGSNLPQGFTAADCSSAPFGIELGFETDDVGGTVRKAISAGGIEYEKAQSKPWGQVVAYVRDLDGFLIEIGSPVVAT